MVPDFSRNLGLITPEQQLALQRAKIFVCGVGGMGGIAAEALVRMGVGELAIADFDCFEASNINRQMHCTQSVVGEPKVDVVGAKLLDINPSLVLKRFGAIDEHSANEMIGDSHLVINGMDCVRASIVLERAARKLGRTIIDAWITPYATVFVMTPSAPHWEEFLDFPTSNRPIGEITDHELEVCLRKSVEFTFRQFEPYDYVAEDIVKEVIANRRPRPSLVPVVWMSGIMMANEAMKLITGQGRVATHWGTFYDQYNHRLAYLEADHDPSRSSAVAMGR